MNFGEHSSTIHARQVASVLSNSLRLYRGAQEEGSGEKRGRRARHTLQMTVEPVCAHTVHHTLAHRPPAPTSFLFTLSDGCAECVSVSQGEKEGVTSRFKDQKQISLDNFTSFLHSKERWSGEDRRSGAMREGPIR